MDTNGQVNVDDSAASIMMRKREEKRRARKLAKNTREKKRRVQINSRFDMLRQLVFTDRDQQKKAEKCTILADAITTIRQLRGQNEEQLARAAALAADMANMNAYIASLRQSFPSLPPPPEITSLSDLAKPLSEATNTTTSVFAPAPMSTQQDLAPSDTDSVASANSSHSLLQLNDDNLSVQSFGSTSPSSSSSFSPSFSPFKMDVSINVSNNVNSAFYLPSNAPPLMTPTPSYPQTHNEINPFQSFHFNHMGAFKNPGRLPSPSLLSEPSSPSSVFSSSSLEPSVDSFLL